MSNCEQSVRSRWESRLEDLQAYMGMGDPYEGNEDLGPFNEYGLSFDYVAPYTFRDQSEGYWRYQISWGGPSEEIRFYGTVIDEYRCTLHRAEFWLLNWGDGACVNVSSSKAMRWLFDQFTETGTASHQFKVAMEGYEPQYPEEEDDDE